MKIGAVLFCATVFGQSASMTFPGTAYASGAVTGKPFSAEQRLERNRTLADGTRITDPAVTTWMFRDSQGRTRTERYAIMQPYVETRSGPKLVEIYDPVAGYKYTLDEPNRIAHRVAFSPPPSRSSAPPKPVSATAPQPQTTWENLGSQVIEGVVADGTLGTTITPIGARGNDRPLTSTHEVWNSREMGFMVLSKNIDPVGGETVVRLVNISRAEPDPALFEVPPGYAIVDETGPFTIRYTRP